MNSEKTITAQRDSFLPARLYERFKYAPLGIFFVGVVIIFLTRYIFYIYHPSNFEGRVPSISKSAAYAPGSYLFCVGMIIVCILIFITVAHVSNIYHTRINSLMLAEKERRHLQKLCNSGCNIARSAGVFLALLAVISLEVNDPVHIILSFLFFASQNLAFIFDFFCTQKLNHYIRAQDGSSAMLPGRGRAILFVVITCLSLFYLFMFLTKDSDIYSNNYLAHQVFAVTEYTWATLAFLYPAFYYPEIKKMYVRQL